MEGLVTLYKNKRSTFFTKAGVGDVCVHVCVCVCVCVYVCVWCIACMCVFACVSKCAPSMHVCICTL